MRVLVVDDSRAIRTILGRMMREMGFEVTEAGNGLEALSQLEQNTDVGLALVDWNMPEMNGFDFVKEVRGRSQHNDVRLMMITTETEMEQVIKALEAGANEYVMKPFTAEVIAEKLEIMGIGA